MHMWAVAEFALFGDVARFPFTSISSLLSNCTEVLLTIKICTHFAPTPKVIMWLTLSVAHWHSSSAAVRLFDSLAHLATGRCGVFLASHLGKMPEIVQVWALIGACLGIALQSGAEKGSSVAHFQRAVNGQYFGPQILNVLRCP